MPKTNDSQIRGALLEEALLYLLRASGYRTVELTDVPNDPTLMMHAAGIAVHGRGERHQIDAIGDFFLAPPFGHPLRLLLEAKCYSKPVGIPVVRNAVGVIKDVSEFWVIDDKHHGTRKSVPHKRYHYQYAVFATSGYTREAQRYAFAQDIFLISLAKSCLFKPIIDAINKITIASFDKDAELNGFLGKVRQNFRSTLKNPNNAIEVSEGAVGTLEKLIQSVKAIDKAYLATLNGRFPVFLVPSEAWLEIREEWQSNTQEAISVSITYDANGWYINHADTKIFSFDLPAELFLAYADNNLLNEQNAIDLKRAELGHIEIIDTTREVPQLIWLALDQGWLNRAEARLRQTPRRKTAKYD